MHIKNKKGQSTVEYVLLVTAVVAVLIAFFASNNGFKGQLNAALGTGANDINALSGTLSSSHQPGTSDNSAGAGVPVGYTVNATGG